MHKIIKTITIYSLLLTGIAVFTQAMAEGSFDGHNVNVKFEMWQLDGDKNIADTLAVRNEQSVPASDSLNPDATDFFAMDSQFHLWDIDFTGNKIGLTFTSIYKQDIDNQYMYMSAVGFHFEDVDGTLPDIVGVKINDQFAPSFYNKELVRFDANNIYVNLQGSMCHIAGMGSMPMCDSDDSPTGYNNIIDIEVEFAGGGMDNATIDQFYDWAEAKYPEYFPGHQHSMDIIGYHARFYPETGVYLGSQHGNLYVYGPQFGGLLDLGAMAPWVEQMHNEVDSVSVTVRDNRVELFFHDDNGNDLSLYKEGVTEGTKELKDDISVEFPKHYEDDTTSVKIISKQNPDNNQPEVLDFDGIPDNALIIDLSVGRKGNEEVATDFVNHVFDLKNNEEFDGSTNIDVKYSSFMNVKGETKTPTKMNFYYPVTITIKGSEFNLVLGQYGTSKGWEGKLEDAHKAGMESFEAFEAFEEGDWEEGAKEVVKVLEDVVDIFEDENPWIIGFIGTEERPVKLLNYDGGTTGMAMISPDGDRMMTVIFKDGKKYKNKDYYFEINVYENKKTNK